MDEAAAADALPAVLGVLLDLEASKLPSLVVVVIVDAITPFLVPPPIVDNFGVVEVTTAEAIPFRMA